FVYIGNSECADCSTFSKNLKNEVNNFPLKNSLYLVEISRLHRNKKKWTEFKLKYGFDQTPAFILFKNGKVNSMIQWDEKKGLSSDSFHRWLEENRNDIENLS
ncbi:TPA: thioredoxin, partial [Enterococcus faecalis]|nr:thioredoxin [Enterococcus faecalis]